LKTDTNRLNNKQELAKFIKEAIVGTRYLAEDEFRILPNPELYYKGGGPDLETLDKNFESVDPQQKVKDAFALEKIGNQNNVKKLNYWQIFGPLSGLAILISFLLNQIG
jgi:hypothetical protein